MMWVRSRQNLLGEGDRERGNTGVSMKLACAGGVPAQAAAELRNTHTRQVKDEREQNVPGGGNSTCKDLEVKERSPLRRTRFHLAEVQRP